MRLESVVRAVFACAALAVAAQSQTAAVDSGATAVELRQRAPIATLNGFVENRGQWPADVRFLARRGGIEAVLLDDALVLHPVPRRERRSRLDVALADLERFERPTDLSRFAPPVSEPVPGPPLTLRFSGARAVEGDGVLPTAHHFLLGSGFTRDVPGYERVVFREVAPGIDVAVRADGASFAYDLHLAPGADLDAFSLEIDGATDAKLVGDDVLALETAAGRVEMRIGDSWEVDEATGERVPAVGRFVKPERNGHALRVGFTSPGRDPSRAFVLDPSIVYLTYVGGPGQDSLRDMEVASDGSVYLAADSGTAPTTPGSFQPSPADNSSEAWIGKLSPDGSTLEWGTFLGGTWTELLAGIALDDDGTVVVLGSSWSTDFPVTPAALDPVNETAPVISDLFLTRLTADGSDLVWSTLYGAANYESAKEVALAPSGDIILFADPADSTPPATPGSFDPVYDAGELFLASISGDGTSLLWQTYFRAGVNDIAFDADSNVYLTGGASSFFDITTPGAFKEQLGPGAVSGDGQVTKLSSTGSQVLWATFLGGDLAKDFPLALEVDAAGAVYVAGWSMADDFPITEGTAAQNAVFGFVSKLLPRGTGLVWSRPLSACCNKTTFVTDIAVDAAGHVFVVGDSNSTGIPITPDAFQSTFVGGVTDAHLTEIDAIGESLAYSTYIGGNGDEWAGSVGLDGDHDLHVSLRSSSTDLPTTRGAYGSGNSGGSDMAVAAIDMPAVPWRIRGQGITGSVDTPILAGAGELVSGSLIKLRVRGGAGSSAAVFTIGAPSHAPAFGTGPTGSPSFAPSGLAVSLTTDPQGAIDLEFPWPALPPGLRISAQVHIQDPGAPGGWSATNTLSLFSK